MTIVSATLQAEDHADAWSRVHVAGADYLRQAVHTRWLQEDDELILSLKENLRDARLGDTVAVSEKVVILLTGRVVDIGTVRPGRLALMLARHVRPRTDSCGLSVPEKMEYVDPIHRPNTGDRRGLGLRSDPTARSARSVLPASRLDRSGHRRWPAPIREGALPALDARGGSMDLRGSRAGTGHRREHRRPQRLRRLHPRDLAKVTSGEDAGSGALRQSDGPAAEKHAVRARPARLIAFPR